jgi:hypothetical protein
MLAVHGLYENGVVRIKEPVPDYEHCEVIVTFLPTSYNVEQIKRDERFILSNPKLNTKQEKLDAIDSLLGICKGNTLTLDDIKTERLKRQ